MNFKNIGKKILLVTLLSSNTIFAKIITDFDETKIQPPITDSNEETLQGTICKTRNHLRWDYCATKYQNGEEQTKSFKFSNYGENKIVPKKGITISREFEFMFEGLARSDMGLLVWDMPDEVESHGHLKLMMFFPRLILPAIRYVSNASEDIVIVTLPTKEEVIFNGKTKEILSGVLVEGTMKQNKDGSAINPEVLYTGTGVSIEADRLNDYPVGLSAQNKDNLATIRKKGFNDCKIPVKNLWYTDDTKGGNVFFNKKYVTDTEMDKLLKLKCHFSMFN
ncbi:MAG: hypothetical protein Q7U04_04555 [Bacteriovorax sp.]|nr:hypothetical protein [Bacteriovorax sp.]